MEEKTPKIYAAICGVMEDIGVVGKNDVNKQQGFKYRGIDAVMNALNPAMVKHKIFCVPEVLEQKREDRKTPRGNDIIYSVCRIKYRFFTTDGSSIETVVVGEAMDSGDKATNKAMSIAFKYACFQVFCIPTEELMDDPDKETPDPSKKKKEQPSTENFVTEEMINDLKVEVTRIGWNIEALLAWLKVGDMKKVTVQKYEYAMDQMRKKPSKQNTEEPEPSAPPDGDPYYEGLPFN